ncbi:PTS sugar transporter subunit IIB [Clostridium sp.]|uniref:PTS sugar transporter subunit IIB n=1 Tax=Clostridium sp. TaxID=1506 RepID=UPI00261B1889|nr:PTS sugar transporter subunit IIB [Clostridium sp.]
MKILTVCGFGVGTSLLLKMTIESVLSEEGIEGEVEAQDMTSVCGNSADLIFTSKEIKEQIEGNVTGKIINISNFMDKEEIRKYIKL